MLPRLAWAGSCLDGRRGPGFSMTSSYCTMLGGARHHPVSQRKVTQLPCALHCSVQCNRKTEERANHLDRDAEFRGIGAEVRKYVREGVPVIVIDMKNEEMLGEYESNGQQWLAAKQPLRVQGVECPSPEVPRAYPYGRTQFRLRRYRHRSRYRGLCRRLHSWLVTSRRPQHLYEGETHPRHRRRRRQQRLSGAAGETRAAEVRRSDRACGRGFPLLSRRQQGEQSGAPTVFLHLFRLAWRATARLRNHRPPDRENHHRERAEGDLSTGSAQIPTVRKVSAAHLTRVEFQPNTFRGEWKRPHPSQPWHLRPLCIYESYVSVSMRPCGRSTCCAISSLKLSLSERNRCAMSPEGARKRWSLRRVRNRCYRTSGHSVRDGAWFVKDDEHAPAGWFLVD